MDADALVARVIATYRHAKAYRDVGTVSQVTTEGEARVRFETELERFGRFSFSFETHDPTSRLRDAAFWVRSGADGIQLSDPDLPRACQESLDLALAGFIGLSMAASCFVPRLLLPELSSRMLFAAGEPRLGASEALDGRIHDVIEMHEDDELWRVLVASETCTIRRIERRVGARVDSVYDYDAVLTPA